MLSDFQVLESSRNLKSQMSLALLVEEDEQDEELAEKDIDSMEYEVGIEIDINGYATDKNYNNQQN